MHLFFTLPLSLLLEIQSSTMILKKLYSSSHKLSSNIQEKLLKEEGAFRI
jgi:hypothetical protein